MSEKLVVIGNGMAGVRTLEELIKANPEHGYDITVIGAEPHPNYNRIMLSPVLASEKTIDDIILNSHEWYAQNNIDLIIGDAVSEVFGIFEGDNGRQFLDHDIIKVTAGNTRLIC